MSQVSHFSLLLDGSQPLVSSLTSGGPDRLGLTWVSGRASYVCRERQLSETGGEATRLLPRVPLTVPLSGVSAP